MRRREEILAQIRDVPSLPAVVLKLREYLNDPDVDFRALARVIEYDPGLTANVLQLANSAYFGWSREIASIKEAITRLGTERIFQMVLCMSVAPTVRKPVRGYGLAPGVLWRHSVATALGAEKLAGRADSGEVGDAFTAGLLHDVGKVVLGTFVEIDDAPIREIVMLDQLAFDESERMVLGIDHAEAAGVLLERWELPDPVVAAVRWHHDPRRSQPECQELTDLVHVADLLCMEAGWGLGNDGLQYRFHEESARRLGVQIGDAERIIVEVALGLEELRGLFRATAESEQHGVPHPAG